VTRVEAYAVAEKIVGPVGKINVPVEMLLAITAALMKVQEETVIECWMVCQMEFDGIGAEAITRRRLQKKFAGVELP